METRTVLALACGPRRGGNSETLLDAFLEPAIASGAGVKLVRVPDLKIGPCRGCHFCEGSGECIQKDGMEEMYPLLLESEEIVIATPVFFYNFPGQAKIFIDRAQPLWARKYLPAGGSKGPVPISRPGRRGFLVAAGATKGKNLFKGLEWTARYFFDAIDVSPAGAYTVPGVDGRGDAKNLPGAVEGASEAGRAFFGAPRHPAPDGGDRRNQ